MGLARKFSYRGHAGRRNFWALILVTAGVYFVSFVFAHQGSIYYEQYIAAHEHCYMQARGKLAKVDTCLQDPEVSALLEAHRQAYTRGEPFFNLGLFLSFLVFMGGVVKMAVGLRPLDSDESPRNGAASGTA